MSMSRKPFSRRALIGLGLASAGLLVRPGGVYALALKGSPDSVYPVFPHLSESEVDQMLKDQIDLEVEQIIAEAEAIKEGSTFFDRPRYYTVMGTAQYIWSPWRAVAGQPAGGTSIQGGGTAYATTSGGGTISFSYSFPTPYGSFGLSCPLGQKSARVTGYGVSFPDSRFYKVEQRGQVKAQPYIVYVKQNGKSKVYRKMVSSVVYRNAFRAVRA